MSKDESFHQYVMEEVLNDIEGITSRPMFGGWGIYMEGIFFGLIADGQLYFKVDESNQKDYEKQGSKAFVYEGHKGKKVTMTYWELPADIMEDKNLLVEWVKKSANAAKFKKK